jgi:PAS domain S-box-containing protein
VDNAIQTALKASGHYEIEYRIMDAKGTLKWVWEQGQAIADTISGKPIVEGFITDITERKQSEDKLKLQAMVLDQIHDRVLVTDLDGTITYANRTQRKALGFPTHELIGRKTEVLGSDSDYGASQAEIINRTLAEGSWHGEVVNYSKNGTAHIMDCRTKVVRDAKDNAIALCGISTDITEEKKLEEKLGQAQKMEAIGTLAGGIAHDFNNILFPMVGYAEMLKEDLADGSPQQEYVADILSAALRARDLVQQILAFSRQSHQERIPIRVQQVLKEAVKLTRASLPSSIRVDVEIDTQCPAVMADPTQIHQIVMNLITNAYHAMEEGGGVLTISLGTAVLDGRHPKDSGLPGGTYVCLKIADTGHGIDPIIQERIFEPYFTTKAEGKGTGLGLSVIHGIVTSYQGNIRIESELGKGSVFIVYLPVVMVAPKGEPAHEKISIPGGSERILLVDDEAPVVGMVNKMLQRLGYAVTTRTSSTEALEAFRADPNRFDLVVTDMTMPGMTGDRLTMEIKRIRPDIPVILCTGFSNRIDESRAADIGIQGFVLKPILRQDIAETIRRVLGDQ